MTLTVFAKSKSEAGRYRTLATNILQEELKSSMLAVAENYKNLSVRPAESFYEAVQPMMGME